MTLIAVTEPEPDGALVGDGTAMVLGYSYKFVLTLQPVQVCTIKNITTIGLRLLI